MQAIQHLMDPPSFNGLRQLALLLCADDLASVSMSLLGLRAQLDVLCEYTHRLGLTISVDKIKAVVFSVASTPVCSDARLLYHGESIAFVEFLTYLRVDMIAALLFRIDPDTSRGPCRRRHCHFKRQHQPGHRGLSRLHK